MCQVKGGDIHVANYIFELYKFLKKDNFAYNYAKPTRFISDFISKNFKKHESSKEIIPIATKYYFLFTRVVNFL
jgi:hypothetical protein